MSYDISEHECQIIENWINSEDCPASFGPTTIKGILNHWRREKNNFTIKQETALLNVYIGYKLYEKKSNYDYNASDDKNDDICYSCMNTGRQYYSDGVYGSCLECALPEICPHPSE